ncbi:hypothetical protein AK830_g38 [Neonectria ditissima]|uniref:Fucose-specific lectin n=1 Tax=Neonectria ditissima TaxID=78410 RepID=A0A0P7C3N7_9HYPO|nr:hypothetical protein AK830_g38 [Neonectria ditissima]
MVALTAIHDDGGAPNTQLHLYYNNQNKNLGLQFRNELGSYLASTKFNNQELIFGVTEKPSFAINAQKDCRDPGILVPVDIALVSPVYKTVASAFSDNYKIAACSSDSNTWIFYLKKNDEGALNIFEAVIGVGNDDSYPQTTTILPGSALAAYYDSTNDTRYIIYQGQSKNSLREYVFDQGDSPIDSAKGVAPKSTFGVAVTETTVYLYYIDTNNDLNKVTKPLGGSKWSPPVTVTAAKSEIATDSQLTVSTADGKNHIFYQAKGQSPNVGYYHVIDNQ